MRLEIMNVYVALQLFIKKNEVNLHKNCAMMRRLVRKAPFLLVPTTGY